MHDGHDGADALHDRELKLQKRKNTKLGKLCRTITEEKTKECDKLDRRILTTSMITLYYPPDKKIPRPRRTFFILMWVPHSEN